ncbi:uncharacterized protein PITG_20946 [Phytophthora infestans T30-4]|uniref:ZSWIM1/3 RNaseH-like domain-containing protein n=1 Tax=Phytophthora infestans (strain T30-4) TaxID=403677 RepID=D0P2U1_PHYIT|nr:uncharacterized protein PITG_20946 [Phytophthora infestans T30-4]EEY57077.1 hypothetical protein PITG_20946 [Phytophthora infestans T30-4]|eukprot:XP_002895385.1 hypothetical protein PITG_20946 [Phytophthora infestans T30-4]
MFAVGAKRSKIYDNLLEHDQNVIKADVDSMVQDFASSVSSLDENNATDAEVGDLAADPVNSLMRQMFSHFGEVLLVDSTHKTNSHIFQKLVF